MIIHFLKDTRDPSFDSWDIIKENGDSRFGDTHLKRLRNFYGTVFHRGVHPDKTKVPSMVQVCSQIQGYSIYWTDTDTKTKNFSS